MIKLLLALIIGVYFQITGQNFCESVLQKPMRNWVCKVFFKLLCRYVNKWLQNFFPSLRILVSADSKFWRVGKKSKCCYCLDLIAWSFFCLELKENQMGRAHEGWRVADCHVLPLPHKKQICQWYSTKPCRQKFPTFCYIFYLTTPGRRLPATGAPLPTYPQTVTLRLALRRALHEFHRSPCARLPAFHSHFLTAHDTGTAFLIYFLYHVFFRLSHHATIPRAKSPVPDVDAFKLLTLLVHCASHHTASSAHI